MIAMSLELSLEQKLELESPHKGAVKLYAASEKASVEVRLGKSMMSVPVALVSVNEMAQIFPGERYAGTMGGMFFITRETPESYQRFAAFHELAEHAALKGFDVTGLAKHFQAVAVELGYAKSILPKEDYEKYFSWRKSVERTNFFRLKDDGLIDRITGKIEEIFTSMPQFLTYDRKQLAGLIEDQPLKISRKQSEAKKMSLIEKLTEQNHEYQKALARCEEEYSASQTKSVLAEFDRTSKALAEKAKPSTGNANELKSALDKLQEAYDSGNEIVKSVLEDKISRIKKDYDKQAAAEAQAQMPLQIELLWNSSNGDKELIIPIKWDSRLNKNSPKEHSIAEKLYAASVKAIMGYDLECNEEEWCGYTRIISNDVAGKSAEGLEPKEFVISLSSDTLTEHILKEIGKELQDANIKLNIINSKIRMHPDKEYKAPSKEAEPKAKKDEAPSAVAHDELSDICHQLANADEAAELLGVDRNTVVYKIAEGNIHGLQYGPKKVYTIPVHDLITYLASHPRTGFAGKANKFEKEAKDLTLDEFAKYKSDVGEVLTVREASAFLGAGNSTVSMWLNNGKMHGVKHQSIWYIPKIELELCKKLYLADLAGRIISKETKA